VLPGSVLSGNQQPVTSAQVRMARAALNWTVRDLAEATGLHRNTITNIEVGRYAGNQDSLEQIESVFRNGGIEFLADNGVRLLKPEVTKEGGADRESRRIAPRLRRRAGR
jgi:DNA-binding XRE family transcriptional regulator